MTADDNIRLLYELNAKDAQLDFAIKQAEHQLASVNKKLKYLWHDLALYAAMVILPELICELCARMYILSLMLPFLVVFHTVLRCVYLLFLPFVIYQLGRTVYLLKINRENTEEYPEPPRLGTLRDNQPNREPTYRIEQKKLIYILSRYYLNQDTINQIRRRISDSESDTMTMAELKYQLNNLPFYEEIRPADPFMGRAGNNIVLPMVCSIMIGLIYVFRVWGIL